MRSIIEQSLQASHYGDPLAHVTESALEVFPDRVVLPAEPGGCDPLQHLPAERCAELREQSRTVNLDNWSPVPKACHKITRENEIALIRRMVKDGMGEMVSARDILAELYPSVDALRRARRRARYHGYDVALAGGWFAVPHKAEQDRLIYDRRPANATELRFKWSTLPHGSQLAQLVVPTTWSVRGSLKDLRAYFFCLSQLPGQLCKNAVGREWAVKIFLI
jgi:hypothetical protein